MDIEPKPTATSKDVRQLAAWLSAVAPISARGSEQTEGVRYQDGALWVTDGHVLFHLTLNPDVWALPADLCTVEDPKRWATLIKADVFEVPDPRPPGDPAWEPVCLGCTSGDHASLVPLNPTYLAEALKAFKAVGVTSEVKIRVRGDGRPTALAGGPMHAVIMPRRASGATECDQWLA